MSFFSVVRIDCFIDINPDHYDSFKQVHRLAHGDCHLDRDLWIFRKAFKVAFSLIKNYRSVDNDQYPAIFEAGCKEKYKC